jgi:dimethylamine/trimethylamine dehydrogenase
VLVTARDPRDGLVTELQQSEAGAVRAVGDAWCPATIAAAVWDGHRYAQQLEQQDDREVPFLREVVKLADQPAEASA